MRLLQAVLCVVASLGLLTACGEAPVEGPPRVGQPFPTITLKGIDGPDLPVGSLRGKVVIFNVWATWCPPCRREMPSLQRLADRLDPQRFAVVAMSVDRDANLVREFNLRHKLVFAGFIDRDQTIVRDKLATRAYPETYIIGRDGTLLRHLVGGFEWDSREMIESLEYDYQGKDKSAADR